VQIRTTLVQFRKGAAELPRLPAEGLLSYLERLADLIDGIAVSQWPCVHPARLPERKLHLTVILDAVVLAMGFPLTASWLASHMAACNSVQVGHGQAGVQQAVLAIRQKPNLLTGIPEYY